MSIQIDSDRNAIEKDGKLADPETGEDLGNFWDLSCKRRWESEHYYRMRVRSYPPQGEQLDMIFKDQINGTNKWFNMIKKIKETYPKNYIPEGLKDGPNGGYVDDPNNPLKPEPLEYFKD